MKKLLLLLLVMSLVMSLATSCSVLDALLGSSDGEGTPAEYDYTDFTPAEKEIFNTYIGLVIPFAPNYDYSVEGYYDEDDFENGINFYALVDSEDDFDAYRALYSDYELVRTEYDEYNDPTYFYVKGNVEVSITYFTVIGVPWIDVYVTKIVNEGGETPDSGNTPGTDDPNPDSGNTPGTDDPNPDSGNTPGTDDPNPDSGNTPDTDDPNPDSGNTPGTDDTNPDDNQGSTTHLYTDFTAEEKALLTENYGFVIPFIANNEYELDATEDEYGPYIYFYTTGNTEDEFNAYLEVLSSVYTLEETYIDDYGDTCYLYSHGDIIIDICYYGVDGIWYVDAYIYESIDEDEGDQGQTSHLYTDFTANEKALFIEYFGFAVPLIPNSEYYFEDMSTADAPVINFYTYGNTAEEYYTYRNLLESTYTFSETYVDNYGDTCYVYCRGETYIEIAFYESTKTTKWCVDVFVYQYASGSGSVGEYDPDLDIITNEGTGLPTPSGDGGEYSVDLSVGNIGNVTEQGYFLNGCPTTGSPAVLVIPLQFSDVTAASKGYTLDTIRNALLEGGKNDYYSLYDYYLMSSYGKLELDITILDDWFTPKYSSSYYYRTDAEYDSFEVDLGDQMIIDEVLAYYEDKMDLSRFDSNGDGVIDSIIIINTLEIDNVNAESFYWAYRYQNYYKDENGYYYEYDGVYAYYYLWASYQFFFETIDENGSLSFDDETRINTNTLIHEFGHVLGLADYYDTSGIGDGLYNFDVMDSLPGDHNPYSKFNLGWITSTRLIITLTETTVDLYAFGETGDTIILANDWSDELGVYQEYYVIMYYRNTGLNGGDIAGYFDDEGIIVYRVEASIYREEADGEVYYDVYNNNTDPSDYYGTERNLIEFVVSEDGDFLFEAGEMLPDDLTDWGGDALGYTFTVEYIGEDYATLTFEKLAA